MNSWEEKRLMNNREEEQLFLSSHIYSGDTCTLDTIRSDGAIYSGDTCISGTIRSDGPWHGEAYTKQFTQALDLSRNSMYGMTYGDYIFAYMVPEITKIIVNDPATIVFFKDGTKVVVKCMEGEDFSPYTAVAYAIAQKVYRSNSHFKTVVDKKIDIKNLRDDCKYAEELAKE